MPPRRPEPVDEPPDAPELPDGPITDGEVIGGIRRMAHGDTADTTRLRAWELLGRAIGLFKDSPSDGGAPVVRLTPPLDQPSAAQSQEAIDDVD